jgi:hypothetical protein
MSHSRCVAALLVALSLSACTSTTRWVGFRLDPGRTATVRVEGEDAESAVRNDGPGPLEVEATPASDQPPRAESLTFGSKSQTVEGPVVYTIRTGSGDGAGVTLEARDADDVKLESVK